MKLSELIYYLQRIYDNEGEKEVYVSDSGGHYDGLTVVNRNETTVYLDGYVDIWKEELEVEE